MALPMTLIIIAGEIDLSVESMAGLSCAVLGFLWAAGVPLEIGIPLVLVVGALGGLLNGLLVAAARPPLARRHPRHAGPVPRPRPDRPRARRASATSRRSSRSSASATCPGRRSRGRSSSSSVLADRARASCCTGPGSAARSTRSARTPAPPATPASASQRLRVGLFVLSRPRRGPRRRHPHRSPLERPGRRRPGHDPDRRDRRPARRRQHLRRLRARSRASSWRSSPWRSCRTPCALPACRSRSRASPSGCS